MRVYAPEQREYPRTEYYSDDEEAYQEEARAQAYVINNRASTQSVRPTATAAPALVVSAWDRQFHDMMTRFPHVGLKWLALILQNWPRDLPVDPAPGTTVTPVIRCSHQPCNSCFNECVASVN